MVRVKWGNNVFKLLAQHFNIRWRQDAGRGDGDGEGSIKAVSMGMAREYVLGIIQRLDWDAANLEIKENGSGQEQVRCEGGETPESAFVQGDKSGA